MVIRRIGQISRIRLINILERRSEDQVSKTYLRELLFLVYLAAFYNRSFFY